MSDPTSVVVPEVAPESVAKPPKIRYKVECEDSFGPNFDCKQDDVPFELQVSQGPTDIDETLPVIEIITELTVASKRPKYADYMKMFAASAPQNLEGDDDDDDDDDDGQQTTEKKEKKKKKEEVKTLEGKRILNVGQTKMVVHSPLLLDVIRDVVDYYPSQNLTGDSITIQEPYCALVHYITELRNLSNSLALERTPAHVQDGEQTDVDVKYDHLQTLLGFLEPHVEKTVLPARRRLKKDEPTVTWDDLWYLLRPGSLCYGVHDEAWLGVVVDSVCEVAGNGEGEPNKCQATVWIMDNGWHTRKVGSAQLSIEIPYFEGEKLVTELPVFPRDFFDRTDGGARRAHFIRRGERLRDLIWAGHAYVTHDGECADTKKRQYKGPLIAEAMIPYASDMADHKWSLSWNYALDEGVVSPSQRPGAPRPLEVSAEEHDRELLTEDHLFLMCPVVPAFALAEKFWTPVHIDRMHDVPRPDKAMPEAHIGDENSEIIKALSHRQLRSTVKWSADYVADKGAGVAVLLYGPPGVGKTYTVEATAAHTRRPLVALTIGDLGTDEATIEEELTKWFDLAHRWRAVLLIDEADIFLERRGGGGGDLARNGIVTAFLRKMEYFGGLLFLTTNRIEHIDDAFMSRVHVAIGFDRLDRDRRRAVWASFFDKLARECDGRIRVAADAAAYVLDGEVAELDWNGREIRNALQSAIAIAEYQATKDPAHQEGAEIVVQAEHFRKVLLMHQKFRTYVDAARKEGESSEWSDL